MAEGARRVISPEKGVCWCVDHQATWVFAKGRMLALRGAEQAVWGWLTLSYSLDSVAGLLERVLPDAALSARQRVEQMIADWQSQGLLVVDEGPWVI